MIKSKLAVLVGVVALVVVVPQSSAVAASGGNASSAQPRGCVSPSTTDAAHPERVVDRFLTSEAAKGASSDKVQRDLATALCLTRIDTGAAPRTARTPLAMAVATSQNSALQAGAPSISYDSRAHLYYAISTWRWLNNSWSNETYFPPNAGRNIGGADGFGTAFNTGLILRGYSLTAHGDAPYPASAVFTTASEANSGGASFTFQDKGECRAASGGCSYRLSSRSGQEVISFRGTGACKTVYGFSQYAHSWSSTRITGMGIGVGSISAGTTSQTHFWKAESQPGRTARVC